MNQQNARPRGAGVQKFLQYKGRGPHIQTARRVNGHNNRLGLGRRRAKLTRQYHPDTNKEVGAEARFKKISEAYDVLGDPEKRKKYDRGAIFSTPFGGAPGGGGSADFGSFSDILSNIFNTTAGRGGARTRAASCTATSLSYDAARRTGSAAGRRR